MILTIGKRKRRSLSNRRKKTQINKIEIIDYIEEKPEQRKSSSYIKILSLALGLVSLCTIAICLIVFFTMKKKVKSKEIFNESNFVINTNVNSLSQFLMKSYQKHNSVSNVINSSFSVFTQAKYDIYTLNESNPEQNTDLYTKKYKTVIIINSQCISFEENNKNCELDKYLDLTIKNKTNTSITNENIEEIKKAILPICIIEHTDNNIIFTITCPENLSVNLKNNIISAFQSIKPISLKENYNNYNLARYTINSINNHKEINIFDKRCDYSNENYNCETITNLTTDNMGNLEKSNKISKFEMIKDDKNKYYNNLNYSFENITTHKDGNNDEDNFKYNLNIILDLIKPLMKKEEFITINMLNNSTNNISNFHFSKRKLEDEENMNYIGVKEESFFNQQLFGVNLGINLKNDFGLGNLENAKVISDFIRGEDTKVLLNEQIITNINKTLEEFIILSKAGNKLANSLYQHLNESFISLKNIINSNITNLNNLLSFTDLSSVFDSTLAINNLKEVPTDIISTSLKLYHNINTLNNIIEDSISNIRDKLKNNIGDFLSDSHELLNIIINNLTELSNILSSNKSRITEISTYYLNYTDTSYINIVQNVKLILENYYINEKNLTDALLDDIFYEFSNNFIESMRIIQSLLDNVINKLKDGTLKIKNADNRDKQGVINNLSYTKIRINDILSNIKKILRNKTGIQENGYYESQKELDKNKKEYKDISDKAFNISYILDNNLLIDTTFDNIMNDFKNEFINLLNNIEKSKKGKFPLKNNMFLNSSFIINSFDKMDEDFKYEKIQIVNYIIEENDYYLESVEEQTNTFIEENKEYLDQLINNIDLDISELFLNNLDLKYSEMLDITFNSINNLIENNNRLAVEYLTQVKNAGSTHCSQLFINKAYIFFDSLIEFKNYIKLNLNNDLINKYESAINQTKNNLQIIKLNPIIDKYQKQLNFTRNHLRIIDILIPRINKYFSDELLNKKYLTKINNYSNFTYNNLIQIETNLKSIYNSVSYLAYSSSTSYDYFLLRVYCYTYCSTKIFGKCLNHKTECINYYDGYTVSGTNNYEKIKDINLTEYSNKFDLLFNNVDSDVSNNILLYNNTLEIYDNNMNLIKEEILNNTKNYLNGISEKINYFINEELLNHLTLLSYNYFKEEIRNKLTLEMSNIFLQWKEALSKINTKIKSNIGKFKYSIQEYGIISEMYNIIYSQNISYNYATSIIEQRKNDFNYTLEYYYNMLLSKVNDTYSFILNNMPFNDEILNDILSIRNDEVKESYINKMNQIWTSKDNYLLQETQLDIIGVNESDFFDYNSYLENNNNFFMKQLLNNYEELLKEIKRVTKKATDESIISRLYLENIQNERQIKEIYDIVDKETIIDLKNDEYKDLISDILKIEIDEFIKNIKNQLIKSNNIIISNFEEEKEKYETILRNKIYKELYTKEELDNIIDIIYENGLNISNINSTYEIYEHLNEILDKIASHISNEVSRLTDELTSYSNNYEKIENTLNNYKTSIYNKIYSSILSINNEFYSNITNIFYINYIEKHLNKCYNNIKSKISGEESFLNITINLNDTINEIIEILINEYKYLTINHINYLNQKSVQELDELFSFSSIENKINSKIDNIYDTQLLPILKNKAIYNSSDDYISDYDLSDAIKNDINSLINEKIEKINQIIEGMKGDEYNIEENWKIPDFTLVQKEELLSIKKSFNNFANIQGEIEEIKFDNITLEKMKNNFKVIIENFIPSFGKDYFERIFKYNEIQQIKSLYNNLKYSLTQTINYYIELSSQYPSITLPEDLKNKILVINNIDSLINSLNNEEILQLNKQLNNIIEETKDYCVDKYIYYIKVDSRIELSFDKSKKKKIYNLLDDNREIFENEYYNLINNYIIKQFKEQFINLLNEESNNMLAYIEEKKNLLNITIDPLNTIKTDYVLSDIENILNNTTNAINNYNTHFHSFKISEEVPQLLNNYCKNKILPYYDEIKFILDYSTKDIVILNLDKNVKYFKDNYLINKFESTSKSINNNLYSYFNKMNNYLKYSYGAIDTVYLKNLDMEIENYKSIRRLDEMENIKKKIEDNKLNETLKLIKNSSLSIIEFIINLNQFLILEEKIKKYINQINEQYALSLNNIKNMEYNEEDKEKLYIISEELKKYSINYFTKANSSYYQTKKYIEDSFNQINGLIEQCVTTTYEQINNKYSEIQNNFIPINYIINEEKLIEIDRHNENINGMDYIIETKIDKYLVENEIIIDIQYEDGTINIPKVVGKIINKSRPHKMIIDFYTNYGADCEIKGRRMTINFNNINFTSNFIFDSSLNNIIIYNNIDFDKYNIKNEKYTIKELNFIKVLGGITFVFPQLCISTIDGENEIEKINAKKNSTIEIFKY